MQRKWVESTASGQWHKYLTASRIFNVDAAGKTSSLGLSPVFFAARCNPGPNKKSCFPYIGMGSSMFARSSLLYKHAQTVTFFRVADCKIES